MSACRLPIVVIVCFATLVTPARTSRAGVIEVAVQAAKSPPAKWFAGFAAGYLLEKGADWGWDQITGKPKIDALNRKIAETEMRYPAYRVYFEALRVNINANTDQLTFEHSIADVVRKIDEDAAAANRLTGTQAPALNPTPATSLARGLSSANGFPLAAGLAGGSPISSYSSLGLGRLDTLPGSLSARMVLSRPPSPTGSATSLLGNTPALPLANPIVSPYGDTSTLTPLNPPSTRWGPGAVVMPTNPLYSRFGLGNSSAAPASPGASPPLPEPAVQPSTPLYPPSGLTIPAAPAYPLHSPYGSGTSAPPWRRFGYAPLGVDPTLIQSLPGYALPGAGTAVTPSVPADPLPVSGNRVSAPGR
jgi:hypothetical protein